MIAQTITAKARCIVKRARGLFVVTLLSFVLVGCGQASMNVTAPDLTIEQDTTETKQVLNNFALLTQIPRPSHHEEKIAAYLVNWAKEHGFNPVKDKANNVIFDIPASQGYEGAPLTILQGHMDMVPASDDQNFDAVNTPVDPKRDGNTVKANGTSLGADDGVGVAMIMTIAESPDIIHGPLRAIITSNEEDGVTGTRQIDQKYFKDAAYLFNIDWEVGDTIAAGSGADYRVVGTRTPDTTNGTLNTAIKLSIDGLPGGHSAIEIDKGHLSATMLMRDFLKKLKQKNIDYELISFDGGTVPNGIPTIASCVMLVDSSNVDTIKTDIASYVKKVLARAPATEQNLEFTCDIDEEQKAGSDAKVMTQEESDRILALLDDLPQGIIRMSEVLKGRAQSSANVGVLKASIDNIEWRICCRSIDKQGIDELVEEVQEIGKNHDYAVELIQAAEPWEYKSDSPLQEYYKNAYKEVTGGELVVEVAPGGLECGSFYSYNPNLDIISVEPTITDCHSVGETLFVDTIAPAYNAVLITLQEIAEE